MTGLDQSAASIAPLVREGNISPPGRLTGVAPKVFKSSPPNPGLLILILEKSSKFLISD